MNTDGFDSETAQSILREHKGNICMHGEFESAGSQISSLSQEGCSHTKSASITPFISLFPLVLYSANSVPGVVRLSQRGGQPGFGITGLSRSLFPVSKTLKRKSLATL